MRRLSYVVGFFVLATVWLAANAAIPTLASTGTIPSPPRIPFAGQEKAVWIPARSMHLARYFHTATVLRNGKVLVAGGCIDANCAETPTAELYDPETGTWALTGSMHVFRNAPSATLLPNGTVLIAGGNDRSTGVDHVVASAELYDPYSGTFSFTGSMHVARNDHPAVLLHDGRVLAVGGDDETNTFASAELYDPRTGTWTMTGSMHEPRTFVGAVLLNNGKVLVAGGADRATFNGLRSAELYDPRTGTWSVTGTMHTGRGLYEGGLIRRGRDKGDVLIAGGFDANSPSGALSTAELYNTERGTFSDVTSMATAHFGAPSVTLPDGNLMVVGGGYDGAFDTTSSVEVYNARSRAWKNDASLNTARIAHIAVLLTDRTVLVSGGFCSAQNGTVSCGSADGVLSSAEVLDDGDESP